MLTRYRYMYIYTLIFMRDTLTCKYYLKANPRKLNFELCNYRISGEIKNKL